MPQEFGSGGGRGGAGGGVLRIHTLEALVVEGKREVNIYAEVKRHKGKIEELKN